MRERAIREGSVGLLILTAVALFGGLVLWLRGFDPRRQSYRVTFVFDNTLGMQEGTAVRFRGVQVGRVLGISPDSNQVKVAAEITQPDLRIPSDSLIQVNQSGLIGDTTVDITPVRSLTSPAMALTPFPPNCNSQVIICDGDQLNGQIGASYESLIRSAEGLANAFANPELLSNLKQTLSNAALFTENGILLTEELTALSRRLQTDVGPLLASANRATDNVGNAAAQFDLTGQEINRLIADNRATLITTLDHINRSSASLETILATLEPAIQNGQFLANLETLSADAAAAMADIRTLTSTLNTPENLVMLQQTLDSARSVFQSAYKVLADVDELTGDPALRNSIRNLINSLNQLVSLTNQLEQSTQVAQAFSPPTGAAVEQISVQWVPPPPAHGPPPRLPAGTRWITYNGQHYQVQLRLRR